jgi:hypothetical protein
MSTHQQRGRSAVASATRPEWPPVNSAVLTSAIAVPLIGFLLFVRDPLVLPSISVVALASAAIIALMAWCMSADRNSAGISLWDVSGAYAALGFAAGMLSDPQHVLDFWFGPTELPKSAR